MTPRAVHLEETAMRQSTSRWKARPDLVTCAGDRVTLSGTLEGDVITVSKPAAANAAQGG